MSESNRISAAEAAGRLGVKRETLYAYVSRGLIESRTLDGKTSTFDPAEVDALVRTRNRPRAGRVDTSIVSSLTHVVDQRPYVRGHDLVALALDGTGFEAVASLLWTGRLAPTPGWHTTTCRNEPWCAPPRRCSPRWSTRSPSSEPSRTTARSPSGCGPASPRAR
jgi:hypothetical protein